MEDEIDFEDLFEVVTPGGLDSRVKTLDAAWEGLFQSNPKNSYISHEYDLWTIWKSGVLESGIFSKIFLTGTLAELDEWKARYSIAYKKAENKNSSVDPGAWQDEIDDSLGKNNIFDKNFEIPVEYIVGGTVILGVGLAWLIHKLSK